MLSLIFPYRLITTRNQFCINISTFCDINYHKPELEVFTGATNDQATELWAILGRLEAIMHPHAITTDTLPSPKVIRVC